MAADTLEERRVFFDAIVAMRAGIPMLIDALGHPQWFVVRNAACAARRDGGGAGGPRAGPAAGARATSACAQAAAGALSRITTPAAARRAAPDAPRPLAARAPARGQRLRVAAGQAHNAAPLAAALDAELDGDVQLGILAALGRLGTPDAVQKLVKAVRPHHGRLRPATYRVAALEALAQRPRPPPPSPPSASSSATPSRPCATRRSG